jgi:hypothetical protein
MINDSCQLFFWMIVERCFTPNRISKPLCPSLFQVDKSFCSSAQERDQSTDIPNHVDGLDFESKEIIEIFKECFVILKMKW